MTRLIGLFILTLLSICANGSNEAEISKTPLLNMTPADMLSIPSISDPSLSSDGKYLIYLQSEMNWKENKRYRHIWRKHIPSNQTRQLTFGKASSSSPLFSPDGKFISFVSRRSGDKASQIYLMHSDGGEAFRLADLPSSPRSVRWSDDNQFIYYVSSTKYAKAKQKKLDKKQIIESFENTERQNVLWKIDVKSGAIQSLTDKQTSVRSYHFSKDGESLVYSKSSGRLIDDRHNGEIWLAEANGNKPQRLTNNEYYESGTGFSPNKRWLAYTAHVNSTGENYYDTNLFLFNYQKQKHTNLTADFTGRVEVFEWSDDGKEIFFLANIGVSTHLHSANLKTGKIKQITNGDWTIRQWRYLQEVDEHLLVTQSATLPSEVWHLKNVNKSPSQLTFIHQDIKTNFALPEQRRINWKSHDGIELEGLMHFPVGYKRGNTFPLVVQTHGGPRSSDQFGIWSTTSYIPVLAGMGYGVLRVNHRGGAGYGDEFLRDMVGGYFKNAHLDVLSGVDYVIEQGWADADKLIKMGWSAGGHMTNKMITFTDRFKAASSGAGAVEWMSHYGETDTSYNRTAWFGGKPWQKDAPIQAYVDNSPLSQLWKVTTPTIIFVGEKDVRVPSTQSKILFRGLRDLNVETELYIAPGEPHGFSKPTHRLFKINKELEWFEHHVRNRKYKHQQPPKSKDEMKNNGQASKEKNVAD